jgi:hypothetical protein
LSVFHQPLFHVAVPCYTRSLWVIVFKFFFNNMGLPRGKVADERQTNINTLLTYEYEGINGLIIWTRKRRIRRYLITLSA